MILDFVILGGYGHYVWPAFIFAFIICSILYLKTRREFLKQEKLLLNNIKQPRVIKIKSRNKEEALSDIRAF